MTNDIVFNVNYTLDIQAIDSNGNYSLLNLTIYLITYEIDFKGSLTVPIEEFDNYATDDPNITKSHFFYVEKSAQNENLKYFSNEKADANFDSGNRSGSASYV